MSGRGQVQNSLDPYPHGGAAYDELQAVRQLTPNEIRAAELRSLLKWWRDREATLLFPSDLQGEIEQRIAALDPVDRLMDDLEGIIRDLAGATKVQRGDFIQRALTRIGQMQP